MKSILLQIKSDSVHPSNIQQTLFSFSIWLWVAIIELIIILVLLSLVFNKRRTLKFSELNKNDLKKSKESDINMDNLMSNINNSKELYNELSKKCHPDRFINSTKQKIAEEIFQEITLYKRNYEKLLILKERAINELNLSF